MKIEQLIQALKIVETGSMTLAAQELYMAQPNLSTSMKNLEAEMNHQIFLRSNNGTTLTPFGKQFIEQAKITVRQFEYIKGLASMNSSWAGNFSVSSYYFLFVARLYLDIMKAHLGEDYSFDFKETSRTGVIDNVAKGLSEIGVISIQEEKLPSLTEYIQKKGLEYNKISSEKACVLVGAGSDLINTAAVSVPVSSLSSMSNVDYDPGENAAFESDVSFLDPLDIPSTILVSDRDTLLLYLQETNSFHIATKQSKAYNEYSFHDRVVAVPLSDCPLRFEIGWIKVKDQPLSILGQEFLISLQKFLVLD